MVLVVNFFVLIFKNFFFCFVVAIFDLDDVEAIFPLSQLLTASGNLF